MLATIQLPVGTDRIRVGDMPVLIADAIHPPLPEGTPRVLARLEKEAVTPELAAEWCGAGNNFPLSLSDDDLDQLNRGLWSALTPLELMPMDDGPRRVKGRMIEPAWEPYRLAYLAAPALGWQLQPVWTNPVIEQWFMHHEAVKEWKKLISDQAMVGTIRPRLSTTLIPTPGLVGRQLDDSFLTAVEFAAFAERFGVTVSTVDVVDAPPPGSSATLAHRVVNRSDPLAAVIEKAKGAAVDRDDYQSVWAALVEIVKTDPPAPVVGYVPGEGVQYMRDDGSEELRYFKKDALRKRMNPQARGA